MRAALYNVGVGVGGSVGRGRGNCQGNSTAPFPHGSCMFLRFADTMGCFCTCVVHVVREGESKTSRMLGVHRFAFHTFYVFQLTLGTR